MSRPVTKEQVLPDLPREAPGVHADGQRKHNGVRVRGEGMESY